MTKSLCIAVVSALAATARADDAALTSPRDFTYDGNPLVPFVSSTDPDAHVWDDEVWLYCSQDHPKQPGDTGTYDRMDGYHAFSSKDLVHWTDHGEILHTRDIPWALGGWLWAPGAARKDGTYFLYYPVKNQRGRMVIGVATGPSPAGPFKDTGHPIEGTSGYDPAVFVDDDGQAYLYCNDAEVAKLTPDLTALAEPVRHLDYAPADVLADKKRRFGEGAYLHKHDGRYYFSYTNQFNKTDQGFYAIGAGPYGPFEWKGAMAPKPDGSQYHHSVIDFHGQSYDFYHVGGGALKPEGYKGSRRVACFDKLFYNDDGTIQKVVQTSRAMPSTMPATRPNAG